MKKIIVLNFCLFIFAFQSIGAQSILTLKQKIGQVLEGNAATVGVAIQGVDPTDTISINGHLQLPMQSVFKYHLALTTLHYVDQGKCKLEDSIVIDKEIIVADKVEFIFVNRLITHSINTV